MGPIDTRYTRNAARMLKNTGARVVVVPIEGKGLTEDGTELLEKIASRNKQDNTLIVEDASKLPEVVKNLEGHTDLVLGVAFSPDGQYALTGSTDRTATLWLLASGEVVKNTAYVSGVAFSPDGQY